MLELDIDRFLNEKGTILDVRTPSEFKQGRIPMAANLPLFSDEERVQIGTLYKQVGVKESISLGYSYVLPRVETLLDTAKQFLAEAQVAKIHCWRGGMRSRSVAELFERSSIPSLTLKGGYKSYRRWALQLIENISRQGFTVYLLGGMTGSGKTAILHLLKDLGEQVLDLEALACHKGSSFGCLNGEEVRANEQFENEIALQWSRFSINRPIWIEDESRLIGQCKIPDSLFQLMRRSALFIIERPLEHRIERLVCDYSGVENHLLIAATVRLIKRLGSERTKRICQSILKGHLQDAIVNLLQYYDSSYQHSLEKRQQQIVHLTNSHTDLEWAKSLYAISKG